MTYSFLPGLERLRRNQRTMHVFQSVDNLPLCKGGFESRPMECPFANHSEICLLRGSVGIIIGMKDLTFSIVDKAFHIQDKSHKSPNVAFQVDFECAVS